MYLALLTVVETLLVVPSRPVEDPSVYSVSWNSLSAKWDWTHSADLCAVTIIFHQVKNNCHCPDLWLLVRKNAP